MATSGSRSVTVTAYDTLRFSWEQDGQSIASNSTTIRWTLELISGEYGRIESTVSKAWSVTVNGNTYSGANTVGIGNNTTKKLASGVTTIPHNADGTKSFAYSFSQTFGIVFNGTSIGTITGSSTGTLNTIPRATTPTLSASSVDMGSAVTISLPRASSGFTHDLAYSFGGAAYVSIAAGVATSYSWTVPDLVSSIPNAASGTMTVRCITKNGSTTIGTKTVTLTAKVPASVVPVISSVAVTEATAGLAAQFGAYIQSKSKLAVVITAAGAKGSTVKSYKTTLQGATHTAASFTSAVLTAAGTLDLVTTVTDSRGRTATKVTSISVLAYTAPQVQTFAAYRYTASGEADPTGEYVGLRIKYSVPSLNGGNTAAMKVEYKQTTATSYSSLLTGSALSMDTTAQPTSQTLSGDSAWDLRITVTDYFGASTTYSTLLPTAAVVLDFKADGTGVAFGKVAERANAVEFARSLYDRFDTLIGNGLARYTGSAANAIDPDTTLDHLIVTDKNTPTEAFYYVQTFFYSSKATTTNRAQLAVPYSSSGSLFSRTYVAGAWTEWVKHETIVESGTSGIWDYKKYSDGSVDMVGKYNIANTACNTALGNWYRTALLSPTNFPFTVTDPHMVASYESNGYGAVLWATAPASTTSPAKYYLIRPTSATIESGTIVMHVTGRWN